MAPKGKSSASTATRKKQAKKAAQKAGDDPAQAPVPSGQPLQRGQKKSKADKKATKVKQYIPPPAPPRGEPDPVDRLGLGRGDSLVAPERVITLRKIAKKDAVTVERGVEEWEEWARATLASGNSDAIDELIETIPAWTHHFPRLNSHPSRRIRLLSVTLHLALLENPACRPYLLAPADLEREEYIGGWLVCAWDADRQVRRVATEAWQSLLSPEAHAAVDEEDDITLERYTPELLHHLGRLILSEPEDHSSATATPPRASKASVAAPALAAPTEPGTGTRKLNALDEPPSLTRARLRASAFDALAYLLRTHKAPMEQEQPSFDDFVGDENVWKRSDSAIEEEAGVRRALWGVLNALISREALRDLLQRNLELISREAFPHVFTDLDQGTHIAMVNAIVPLLQKNARVWKLADAPDEKDGEEDGKASREGDAEPISVTEVGVEKRPPPIVQRFFAFLTLACSGNPATFYPALLALWTSLAESEIWHPSFVRLFSTSFWAAVDGRALQSAGPRGVVTFCNAWRAVVVWTGQRWDSPEYPDSAVDWLTGETEKMLEVYLRPAEQGRARTSAFETAAPPALVGVLGMEWHRTTSRELWDTMEKMTEREKTALKQSSDAASASQGLVKIIGLLAGIDMSPDALTRSDPSRSARRHIQELLLWCLKELQTVDPASPPHEAEAQGELACQLLKLLPIDVEQFPEIEKDQAIHERAKELAQDRLPRLAFANPDSTAFQHLVSALIDFQSKIGEADEAAAVAWKGISRRENFADGKVAPWLAATRALANQTGKHDRLPNADLHDEFLVLVERALRNETVPYESEGDDPVETVPFAKDIVEKITIKPHPFITERTVDATLVRLASFLSDVVHAVLYESPIPSPTLFQLVASVSLASWILYKLPFESDDEDTKVDGISDGRTYIVSKVSSEPELLPIATGCFVVGHLLAFHPSATRDAWRTCDRGKEAFANLVRGGANINVLYKAVSRELVAALLDVQGVAHPIDLSAAARTLAETCNVWDGVPIVPSADRLTQLRHAAMQSHALPSSLAVLDPLALVVDPTDTESPDEGTPTVYLRAVVALFDSVLQDRSQTDPRALEDALFVSRACTDALAVQTKEGASSRSFLSSLEKAELEAVGAVADSTATYLVSKSARTISTDWHLETTTLLRQFEGSSAGDELVATLGRLFVAARSSGAAGINAARSVRRVLELFFKLGEVSQGDAERWLALTQTFQTSTPHLALAIVLGAKEYLLDSPRFERYQNELASSLSGVPPSAADSKGLPLLRLLCAVAPPQDSPHIFLPQQRATFLIQALQRWTGSDEDLDDEVYTHVVQLLGHLAPIVQDLGGSHWDWMFDLAESNLEVASWTDATSLPPLWHSCQLLATIKQLSTANGMLREVAKPRVAKALPLVQKLFISGHASSLRNTPAEVIADAMVDLLKDLPVSSLSMEHSFAELVGLLANPSPRARPPAFKMASSLIAEFVEKQVIEAELETAVGVAHEIPSSLLQFVKSPPSQVSGLLGWLLVFKFYEHASFRLRTDYNAQLRNLSAVGTQLLPLVFDILGIAERGRPHDVSRWSFEELDVSLIEDDSEATLKLLAAHTYFKALQSLASLVRRWYDGCRNLQLSSNVARFTRRHCTPLLISRELDRVRDPAAMSSLKDDNLDIRVSSTAREVKAIYTVDEQRMEIAIRIPWDHPLESVEVVDIKKVGVAEAQWRAWLLASQQAITTQGGTVLEALSLFKRNVSLHFEGVEACAICYSIISVTDRSLPTKACRTCHNKFHPSCLFKWFSTSHGSSCPLCRSLF